MNQKKLEELRTGFNSGKFRINIASTDFPLGGYNYLFCTRNSSKGECQKCAFLDLSKAGADNVCTADLDEAKEEMKELKITNPEFFI
jgi:hypothetical protein